MSVTVFDAIQSLRPDSRFLMRGDDITTIEWLEGPTDTPSRSEIDAELARLAAQEAQNNANAAQARAAAIAHAKSLGFTDEMISVMYPNLTGPAV